LRISHARDYYNDPGDILNVHRLRIVSRAIQREENSAETNKS
jgi:hypothetical protein